MGLINYGKITRPHGLKGEVILTPFSRQTENLPGIKSVFIEKSAGGGAERFEITGCRLHKGSAIVRLDGVDSIDEAEGFRGAAVFVDISELPDLEEDEYYWFQLVGLDVRTEDGRLIGKVESLIDRAHQSVLVVRGGGKEVLIPLSEPIIKEIDIKNSSIVITPIEGLTEP